MQKISEKLCIPIKNIIHYMKIYNISYDRYHKSKYICNENIFSENSERAFYLAGFIAADGCVLNKESSKSLKIALSINDIDHLEKIKLLLDSNHTIHTYSNKKSKLVCKKDIYYSSELRIYSKKIVDDLSKFNIIPNKTKIYCIPEWLINHNMVNHFIRGYIDGDGTIYSAIRKKYKYPQISLSLLGNYDTLNIINNILVKNCNINPVKINNKSNFTFIIRYAGNLNLYKLGNFLYKNATIYLDRKKDKISPLLLNTYRKVR